MSDTFLRLIPKDRFAVPKPGQRRLAEEPLSKAFPKCHVVSTVTKEVSFIDCGGNWSGVACPHCGCDAEDWFADEMSRCFDDSQFEKLGVKTPCCKKKAELDGLKFAWPVGFARYLLEVQNPNVKKGQPPKKLLESLEQAIGGPLLVIWAHY